MRHVSRLASLLAVVSVMSLAACTENTFMTAPAQQEQSEVSILPSFDYRDFGMEISPFNYSVSMTFHVIAPTKVPELVFMSSNEAVFTVVKDNQSNPRIVKDPDGYYSVTIDITIKTIGVGSAIITATAKNNANLHSSTTGTVYPACVDNNCKG